MSAVKAREDRLRRLARRQGMQFGRAGDHYFVQVDPDNRFLLGIRSRPATRALDEAERFLRHS